MLIKELDTPISIVNVIDFDIDVEKMKNKLRKAYKDYENDNYLIQKNKIEILQAHLSQDELKKIGNEIWIKIYKNEIADNDLHNIFPSIPNEVILSFSSLQPSRKRLISECELNWDGESWVITRVPCSSFQQSEATISTSDLDYRLIPRKFKELPEFLFDEDLKKILIQVGNKVKKHNTSVKKLSIAIHHTLVLCIPDQVSSNSPEGIHQDGMDYIVSALVVERNNISGGESIIYGADATTPLLNITLQSGQGIFQPDKGTDLWHEVTPISLVDPKQSGYRSTIGFDVLIME
ncbi:2OG-Fe dioxygenase family protein [Bacillus pumilus]|uniref:2OG-Fe dioxygenase family protein n=1 Tax=Bacillus pumilus TaxID=1408 RepID=UPI0011E8B470|nr:2OG-Fe dioxygenase family protein [Bacillus pumilus]TYS30975.1 2OG-Fe dioxygenase family protein [Bacillus pumilus]TYS45758.1 2OG-Fe dioxygenase family protein [Bacillus pumilus]